jgi:predicted nucleic acid-binding protein
MVHKCWIVNASPLILLGKAGYLHLLSNLAEVIKIPSAVVKEIGAKADGKVILDVLENHAQFLIVKDIDVPAEILAWDLGAGETQVIALGLKHNAERVVLDDLAARRCAKAVGQPVIGTLGSIARAKRLGHMEKAEPVIRQLCQTGLYASEDLIFWILKEIKEK